MLVDKEWNCLKPFKKDISKIITKFHSYCDSSIGYRFLRPLIDKVCHGPLKRECGLVAKATGLPLNDLILANLSYEIGQFAEFNPLACTSAAYYIDSIKEYIHARNLDWDFPLLKKHTIIAKFNKFRAVTFPGYVGVLSGVRDGYSISVNVAPCNGWPNLKGWSIGMLVRHVLENASTEDEAIDILAVERSIYPSFVHIVGDDCTVIDTSTGEMQRQWVVTNHYVDEDNDVDDDWLEDSERRFKMASRQIPKRIDDAMKAIRKTANDDTVYSVVFRPKSGTIQQII